MRLDKLLAHMNYGSRKEVKELIRKGFVLVNGEVVYNDDIKVNEESDDILVADERISYEKTLYFILNKPDGYVSATFDLNDPIVLDLIPGYEKRGLFPVGRLDKDTTGLLLISNDGKLAHKLLSPKNHVSKTYELTFSGKFKNSYYEIFETGVTLDDGYICKPAKFELLEEGHAYLTIYEGKYHQVKRMMESVGCHVETLKRISFGSLKLPKDLKEGQYRSLSEEELELLSNYQEI